MVIREYRRAQKCEQGGRFRRCRRSLSGQCQYCARGFCDHHGDHFGEHEAVCQRRACQAKKLDLEQYLQFKEDSAARNDTNRCGIAVCEAEPHSNCERCESHFCLEHLRQHLVEVMKGVERVPEILRLCEHCMERIPLWERV